VQKEFQHTESTLGGGGGGGGGRRGRRGERKGTIRRGEGEEEEEVQGAEAEE
jgi:hypothetical protein